MTERRLRDDALAIWRAGVAAVEADGLVRVAFGVADGQLFVHDAWGRTVFARALDDIGCIGVVGAGKATTAMARAVEHPLESWSRRGGRLQGWINVPDVTIQTLRYFHVHGARKLPDNRPTAEGLEGSRRILDFARSLGEDDLLVVLLSGGGSALMPLPVDGVSLDDKLLVTKLLQERGATIEEMNCVRKHLSQIKGGRLAQATKARVVTLIVSDVIGDPLDVIASGPTAPDPTTFADAVSVLRKHDLLDAAPKPVVHQLNAGAAGAIEETPKELSARVTNVVIGNNDTARRAATLHAESLGYATVDLGIVDGDTRSAARSAAQDILKTRDRATRPACLIDGGETTVSLSADHGKGGRNQEFALAVLDELGVDGLSGACVLCGGTDGEDGPTDAAGAFVDEALARAAARRGLDPGDFLSRHDAYNFFEPLGGLIKTGPTNTNVMDLRVVLIDRTAGAAVPALARPKRKSASGRARPS